MRAGIYAITSPSGGNYIGSSINVASRWSQHRSRLRAGEHPNKALQSAWNKYGEPQMVFSRLIVCEPCDVLMYEQIALDALKPRYNVRTRAESNAGLSPSADTRAKMSASRKGRPISIEQRAKLSAAKRGKLFSAEHRANLAAARSGRVITNETRSRLKASAIAYWAAMKTSA